jgi:enoyl-CoA hydratase/carnithine racemase
MLSAGDYDAELAERYGWINRALPADALDDFVRSLAHRIAKFPAAGLVAGSVLWLGVRTIRMTAMGPMLSKKEFAGISKQR